MNIPWKIKSSIFSVIDKFHLYKMLYFLQKYVTKRADGIFNQVDSEWILHRDTLRKHDKNKKIFEFGAGKHLAQNLFLSIDIKQQVVVDLYNMLDIEQVEEARTFISSFQSLRTNRKIDSKEALKSFGIFYHAPFDASQTDFTDKSIDAIISTNTLEHIPEPDIKAIMREAKRILKDDGIISFRIDYSDHYAHTDNKISLLNFLKFDKKSWNKYNHICHYQNRMRHYEYLSLFEDLGFKCIDGMAYYDENFIEQDLSSKYSCQPQSWSATAGYFVLRKNLKT